jgi:hypothetical protein
MKQNRGIFDKSMHQNVLSSRVYPSISLFVYFNMAHHSYTHHIECGREKKREKTKQTLLYETENSTMSNVSLQSLPFANSYIDPSTRIHIEVVLTLHHRMNIDEVQCYDGKMIVWSTRSFNHDLLF